MHDGLLGDVLYGGQDALRKLLFKMLRDLCASAFLRLRWRVVHDSVFSIHVGGIMAQRRIGQEVFRFGARPKRESSLDELGALIGWSHAGLVLSPL